MNPNAFDRYSQNCVTNDQRTYEAYNSRPGLIPLLNLNTNPFIIQPTNAVNPNARIKIKTE
jgi:hypothetical protein